MQRLDNRLSVPRGGFLSLTNDFEVPDHSVPGLPVSKKLFIGHVFRIFFDINDCFFDIRKEMKGGLCIDNLGED
jgi:hypothetical protein